MALTTYTYQREGITLGYLQSVVPGAGGSVINEQPPIYQGVTWDDIQALIGTILTLVEYRA